MKKLQLLVSLSDQEFKALRKLCFFAGTTPGLFVRALLAKFLADPEKFVRAVEGTFSIDDINNCGADAPGADDFSK